MERKVFIEGKNKSEQAYIGWESEELYLIGVKDGYKSSADDLVDKAILEGHKNRIDILDKYIFPIMFLYRHSIEISLKLIYRRVNGKIPTGHNLMTLWDRVDKDVLNLLNNDIKLKKLEEKYNTKISRLNIDKKLLNEIKNLIKELQGIDSNGDVWRYLINKNGDLYFNKWKFIDYPNLKNTINYIYEFLDGLYCEVDEILVVRKS